jgi:hypothetical protein
MGKLVGRSLTTPASRVKDATKSIYLVQIG